jgi:tetrapyrrole methylase family protein/MazG family protein
MGGRVVVVGLGPAGAELLTAQAQAEIERVPVRFLRTERHPAAVAVPDARTLDHHYESASRFADVYPAIVEELVAAAAEHGEVLYAVPGSPRVLERTVDLLVDDERVEVRLVPGLSFLDLAWVRLAVDPLEVGVRLVDGHRFAEAAAGERGPLLVAHVHDRHVLSDIKVAFDDETPPRVTVMQRLGCQDEAVFEIDWEDLDRVVEADHLTALYIPELAAPVGAELVRFDELVRTLRRECPWDREQTHKTLTRHLLEETYEVLEAIEAWAETGDSTHLEEELGDLLFQVEFHATLARERGEFTIADVARGIHDKLVRRHPHVFGSVDAETPSDVMRNWEQIKKEEKGRSSLMEGIPGSLPALLYAQKVQKKAANVGFDWDDVDGAWPKVLEEIDELRAATADEAEGELGDVLFAVVNVARHLGLDPETALRTATAKFRDRFQAVEVLAAERGIDMHAADLATLDGLWDEVKAQLRR